MSRSLSVTSWNVNGIFKKINSVKTCKLDDENLSSCMQSDIVCLSETHANSNDIFQYEGYKCFVNCRPSNKKQSGGLATFVKKEILSGVKVMDKSHSDIVWLKLDRTFFRLQYDLYICFVYISPKNSSYTIRTNCDKHIFEKLEGDITKYSIIGDVMIMGDINAHISASEQDYICNEVDDVLDDFLPSICR